MFDLSDVFGDEDDYADSDDVRCVTCKWCPCQESDTFDPCDEDFEKRCERCKACWCQGPSQLSYWKPVENEGLKTGGMKKQDKSLDPVTLKAEEKVGCSEASSFGIIYAKLIFRVVSLKILLCS